MKKNHLDGYFHHEHEESCGCGHDNHHEHGEGCGCGHDHHHEHGENCDCDHDHEHGKDCGCGHDHHHEHGEECGCGHKHGGNQVMVGTMSGHILGVMTAYTIASLPVTEVNMNLSMKDVYYDIIECGGLPLSLKASMKDTQETVLMNMIGQDIFRSCQQESTETDTSKVKVKLQVLADNINHELLKGKLEEIMGYFVNNSF